MSCESCGSNSDLVKHEESVYCGTCRELGLHPGLSSSNNGLEMADKALEGYRGVESLAELCRCRY